MSEDAPTADAPLTKANGKKFTVVLLTIYSVENAGIRYVSAALQRAGFETHIIFLRDWVHNRLEMPSETDIGMARRFGTRSPIVDQRKRQQPPCLLRVG